MRKFTDALVDPMLFYVGLLLFAITVLVSRHARQQRNTTGLLVLFTLVSGLAIISSSPAVVNRLLDKLESRYVENPACLSDYTPLVVLGGGVDSRIRSLDQIHYMSARTLARVSAAQRLIRAQEGLDYPVLLVGGGRQGLTEADVMHEFLRLQQMPLQRMLKETDSLNTYTNALHVAALFSERHWVKKIRLITSALHMERSVGVFKKQGFEVCPISVGRIGLQSVPWYALLPQTSVLQKTDSLLHEVIGILYYRLRGWM